MIKEKMMRFGVASLIMAMILGNATITYADSTRQMTVTAEVENHDLGPDVTTFRVSGYTGTYDGKSHTFGTATIGDASVITYSKDGGNTWQTAKPMVKDVADSASWQVRATLNGKSIYTTANLVVNKKDASITVKNAMKEAGNADPAFTATENGFISGETIDYTIYRSNAAEDTGTYAGVLNVRLNQSYPNYNITVNKGDFTITAGEFDAIRQNFAVTEYTGTYDGKEHTLTVKGYGNANVEYSLDGATWSSTIPTATDVEDSATWQVRASLGSQSVTRTANLIIKKKDVTVTVKNATKISGEDDPDYEASIKGLLTNDTLDYTIYRTDASDKVGKHEGILAIRLNQEYTNYNVSVVKGNLTITENEYETLKDSFEVHGYSGVYDGKDHYVTVDGAGRAKVEFSTDGASWSGSSIKVKNVADSAHIRVRATINGKSIYKEADIAIYPAPVTIMPDDATYMIGKPEPKYTATVTGLVGSERLSYEVYRNETDEDTVGIHQGVLLVRVTANNSNYSISTGAGNLTVKAGDTSTGSATSGSIKVEEYDNVYDGKAHSITVTGVAKGDVTYSTDGKTFTAAKPYIKNVADSTDVIIKIDGKTYRSKITIRPKPATISVNAAEMEIGGEEHELSATVDGVVNQEMLEYILFIDKEAANYPKVEGAGSYEGVISAKLVDDSVVNKNYDVTIKPGTLTLTGDAAIKSLKDVKIKSFNNEYDGRVHTITTNVDNDKKFKVEYSLDGKEWTKTAPKAKDVVDSCKVKVRITLGEETKTLDVDLTVKPKKATISVNDAKKKKGEDDPEFSAEVFGLVGQEHLDYILIRDTEDGKPESVGEHKITAKLNQIYPNYEIEIKEGTLTILKSGISTGAKAAAGVLATAGVGVVIATTGGFNYLWMLLLTLLLRNKRKKWHGILTDEENKFIETIIQSDTGLYAQDIIDQSESPEAALEVLKESGDVTYLPVNTKMEIFYVDPQNNPVVLERNADEEALYQNLAKLQGAGDVNVTLSNKRAKFEIQLRFKL